MKIGISNNQYPEQRNIIISINDNYINLKRRNLYYYLNVIYTRLLKKNKCFLFRLIPLPLFDKPKIIHLFNEVAITHYSWLATFETELPRLLPKVGVNKYDNDKLKKLSRHLIKENCLGLIAISQATLNIQMRLFQHFPQIAAPILAKTIVLHPPQKILCQQLILRKNERWQLVFVGNEFYRKGGAEIVLAISQLIEQQLIDEYQLDVLLIDNLKKKHNIAHRQFQDNETFYRDIETRMATYRCFQHVTSLPSEKILHYFSQSDLGLLPSWQETYGFSVLEMQASGCPVITSSVRALPEINPEEAGWLLNTLLNEDGEHAITSQQDKMALRHSLIEQMKSTLITIFSLPELVQQKSNSAIAQIRRYHDPAAFKTQLQYIYKKGGRAVLEEQVK